MKSHIEVEQQVVDLVMQLIHKLRLTHKINYDEIGRLYYKIDDPELSQERELLRQVISILQAANPQISRRLIISSILYEVVGIVVFNYFGTTTDDELAFMAKEKVKGMLQYSSTRCIDIPIVDLMIDGPPVRIGKVTFHSISEEDKNSEWWDKIQRSFSGNPEAEVLSFGRVCSPGDWEMALAYAETAIREALLFLRGIGFPFSNDEVKQFGLLNEFPVWQNQPLRLHKALETKKLEDISGVVTRIGPSIRIWKLYKDLLKKVDDCVLEDLNHLLNADDNLTLSGMQKKFLNGVRWMGEATKPDTLSAKFLKLSTAYEFLIGGEPSEENLSIRGINASLAERAAFLLGENQENRLLIDQKMKRYYGKRSKIVHGDQDEVNNKDLVEFGELIRQIAFALNLRLSSFNNIDDLQKWVIRLRYS